MATWEGPENNSYGERSKNQVPVAQVEESWEEGSLARLQVSNIRNMNKKQLYL